MPELFCLLHSHAVLRPPGHAATHLCGHRAEPGSSAPAPPPHVSVPAVTSSRGPVPNRAVLEGRHARREAARARQREASSVGVQRGAPGAHGLLPARAGAARPRLRSTAGGCRSCRGAEPHGRCPRAPADGKIRARRSDPCGTGTARPPRTPPPNAPPSPSPAPGSETATSDGARGCQPSSRPYRRGGTGPEGGTPLRARHGKGNPGQRRPEPGGRPAAPRRRARSPRPRAQSPAGRRPPRPSAAPPPALRAAPDPPPRGRARPPLPDGSSPGRREGRRPAASSSSAGGAGQCRALTYRPPPAPPRAGPAGSCRQRGRSERPDLS